MIRGVHHTSFSTNNFDAMVHFYRDLIGFEHAASINWDEGTEAADRVVGLKDSAVTHALLRAGNTFIEIFHYRNPRGADAEANRPACDVGLKHVCLDVVDIEVEYARLVSAGIKFNCPPVQFRGLKCTYGRDPDGNIFEIQEVLDSDSPIHMARLGEDVMNSLKNAQPNDRAVAEED
jgi:glyoxylase I family protein